MSGGVSIINLYRRDVPPLYPETPLIAVARSMTEYKTSVVAIVEKESNIVKGVIHLRTLIKPFVPEYIDYIEDFSYIKHFGKLEDRIFSGELAFLFLAHDVMEINYRYVEENDSVAKALFCIYKHNLTGLVVVDESKHYKGVITRFDILRFLYELS